MLNKVVVALVLTAVCSGSVFAQEAINMSTTELKDEASNLANARRYLEARPYIVELIKRIENTEDKALRALLQQFYFFEAYGYLQEYDASGSTNPKLVSQAIAGFDKVIKNYPNGDFVLDAIKTKANCYEVVKNFEKAVETRALLLEPPYAYKLSAKERYELVKRICQSLFNNRKWKIGKVWFEKLLKDSSNIEDKVFAASALIQTAFSEKKFDDAKKYIPYMVYNTVARNDPALSIEFIKAGDELSKQEKYSQAMVFYNLVFDKDVLIKNIQGFIDVEQKKLAAMKRSNLNNPKITDVSNQIKTLESMLKISQGLPSLSADMMARSAQNFMRTERDYESFWAYYQLAKTFPNHPSVEDFYFAAIVCALKVEKLEAMFNLSNEYLEKFKDKGGVWEKDVQLGIIQYYLKKKEIDTFFATAKKFIDDNGDEASQSKDVIFLMGKTWLDMEKYDELSKTFLGYIKKYPDSSLTESCMYWTGMAYMAQGDFPKAMAMFIKMTDNFPAGIYVEDGTYRRGVAAFGAGHFTQARDTLEEFVQTFPKSSLRGEVEFFLGDVYANVNEVDSAMKHYMAVEKYTKNKTFINNAYIQSAKLLHNVDKYKEEVALMDEYVKKHPKGRLSEAAYNKGKALEMLSSPADSLKEFENAIKAHGNNPKDDAIDRMILEYNRIYKENLEKMTASVEFLKKLLVDKPLLVKMVSQPAERYRYFRANPKIDKQLYEKFKRDKAFGENLYSNKKVLKDLLARYENQLASYPKGGAVAVFNGILEYAKANKKTTLEYRIMMGLDSISAPVKHDKMFGEEDLKKSSVRTLVWVGLQNEKYGADQARKAFKEGRDRDEFEYEIDILFAHAGLEQRQKKWGDVLKLYTAIEEEFPADSRAANAVILKGDAYSKLGKKDKAFKEYETVLRQPNWRGEAHAEALYKLGELAQSRNKNDEALMYYDRCYLGFANCYQWTGKALLSAVKLLSREGKSVEAKTICEEFLNNLSNKASPDYAEIKILKETL